MPFWLKFRSRNAMHLLDNVRPFKLAEEQQNRPLAQEDAMWRDAGYVWWRNPYRTEDELLTQDQLQEALWHAQVQGFLVLRKRFIDYLIKHRDRRFAARCCYGTLCRLAGVMALNHDLIEMGVIKPSKENNAKLVGMFNELREGYEAEFRKSEPAMVESLRFLLS